MSKIRFRYIKTGKAKYLSHLDLMATMQRAFLRAGLNLKYSEGFNPHPYMSVALPLSVGCESTCELIDVGAADDNLPNLQKFLLPDGVEFLEAYKPIRKFSEIAWIKICIKMYYDNRKADDMIEGIQQCFSEKSIVISKRTKRGVKELDIAPHIRDVDISMSETENANAAEFILTAKISAQNPVINSADLESVVADVYKPDFSVSRRLEIYDKDMIVFK